MARTHGPQPGQRTERVEQIRDWPDGPDRPPDRPAAGKIAGVVLLLVAVTVVAAGAGFLLAGGRLPESAASPDPRPSSTVSQAPSAGATTPTIGSKPETQPAIAPTAPPTAAPAAEKPIVQETTAPAPTATVPPQPTALPTAAMPKPTTAPKPTAPSPGSKPQGEPPGVMSPVRPGTGAPAAAQKPTISPNPEGDPRLPQIERRIQNYFAALGQQDFARAQEVCCTPAWRSRFPLQEWQRNFDGVTDLRLVGSPRYLQVEDDVIVVETDYTFVSGGARRDFTLRWTFKPVGDQWQADRAEAFPAE